MQLFGSVCLEFEVLDLILSMVEPGVVGCTYNLSTQPGGSGLQGHPWYRLHRARVNLRDTGDSVPHPPIPIVLKYEECLCLFLSVLLFSRGVQAAATCHLNPSRLQQFSQVIQSLVILTNPIYWEFTSHPVLWVFAFEAVGVHRLVGQGLVFCSSTIWPLGLLLAAYVEHHPRSCLIPVLCYFFIPPPLFPT